MKALAFYLPQFHPTPENNRWWGPGFSEWHNVSKAKPLFKGHRQPQIPADLGFYDLRCEDTRREQVELAKAYGIDGFCYYHYWFSGKRLLNEPFDRMLHDKTSLPFCLCWANETWSRTWDGKERDILIKQEYSEEDFRAHARFLAPIFKDPRYIQINGEPLFLIYCLGNIPDIDRALNTFRTEFQKCGIDKVHLCAVRSISMSLDESALLRLGISDIVDFEPNPANFPPRKIMGKGFRFLQRIWNQLFPAFAVNSILRLSYKAVAQNALARYSKPSCITHYPTVFPNWDNSPRRKAATIIQNPAPELFEDWVRRAKSVAERNPPEQQFLFINAWNEWAESAHLEPDRNMGHSYLEALRKGLGR
ncbi:MAG: glycoside hydrolase family 99-like domain-containing protein [Fibrobacteraceae bacterium]